MIQEMISIVVLVFGLITHNEIMVLAAGLFAIAASIDIFGWNMWKIKRSNEDIEFFDEDDK